MTGAIQKKSFDTPYGRSDHFIHPGPNCSTVRTAASRNPATSPNQIARTKMLPEEAWERFGSCDSDFPGSTWLAIRFRPLVPVYRPAPIEILEPGAQS